MLLFVTFVGTLIHVYSIGYMAHEHGFQRFFTYLNLFMGAMLVLVLGNNYAVTFVGWEGVGLCSYLLIGFYYDQEFPPYAGRKAFIVNRIGDFGFMLGVLALASTLRHAAVHRAVPGDRRQPGARRGAVRARHERRRASSRSASSSAPPARARRCRSTSGCPTRWRARRRCRR